MRGHTSSYVKQFGFFDNFPRPGIFKENVLTGVMKNADVNKILMSHELFWSENKVEELFYLLTTFHCHWTIFEGFRGGGQFFPPPTRIGGSKYPNQNRVNENIKCESFKGYSLNMASIKNVLQVGT